MERTFKEMIAKRTVPALATLVLAAVFIFAGGIKIFDPEGMRRAIETYNLVYGEWAIFGAYFFPWVELLSGLALLIRPLRAGGAFIISGLMAFFTVIIIVSWIRGIKLNCGCFGAFDEGIVDDYRLLLSRDIGLLILGIYLLWHEIKSRSLKK
jgi:uncharacterized membrane protein YphA (DoxX/SURF4 family)